MNFVLILTTIFFTVFAFAETDTFDKVICADAKVFTSKYGELYSDYSPNYGRTASEIANYKLNSELQSYFKVGQVGTLDNKPIQVVSKKVFKPSVDIDNLSSSISQCVDEYSSDQGTCESASVCVVFSMTYSYCKQTKYDENTGKRYAICSGGKKFDY